MRRWRLSPSSRAGAGRLLALLLWAVQDLPAGEPLAVFTTAALSEDGWIYVSDRGQRPGWEPRSRLSLIPPDSLTRQRVPVPEELGARELSALIPLGGRRVLIVSQQTLEGGDAPQVHGVDCGTGRWTRLAELPGCVSITGLRVEAGRLVFTCEEPGNAGDGASREAAVPLGPGWSPKPGPIRAEAAVIGAGSTSIQFEGLPYAWEWLTVTRGQAIRRFRP